MNLISKALFNKKYPELKSIHLDDEIIKKIKNNQVFSDHYDEFSYNLDYIQGIEQKIRYIQFFSGINNDEEFVFCLKKIKSNFHLLESSNLDSRILMHPDFDKLYDEFDNKIFSDNIKEIILSNKTKLLKEFLGHISWNKSWGFNNTKDNSNYINNKTLDFLYSNNEIGKSKVWLFVNTKNIRIDLINKILEDGYEQGLLYVFNNIPDIKNIMEGNGFDTRLLDMNFINKFDLEVYKWILSQSTAYTSKEIDKILKIYEIGNYELISDICKYGRDIFYLLKEEDFNKSIYELSVDDNYKYYLKIKKIFLDKEYGISENDANNYYTLISRIDSSNNKYELLKKYSNEYTFYKLINSEYKLIKENINRYTKEEIEQFKRNYNEIEAYLSSLERITFVELIKKEFNNFNKDIKSNPLLDENGEPILDNNGKEIDVYNLEGQPYMMMAHCIPTKKEDGWNNAKIGNKLQENPNIWDEETGGNNVICSSIISNENVTSSTSVGLFAFLNRTEVIYGFNNFPEDIIYGAYNHDMGSKMHGFNTKEKYYEQVPLPFEIQNKKNYNEVIINRKDKNGNRIRPDYIICFDKINDQSIKHAKYFEIPIYVINTQIYLEQNKEKEVEVEVKNTKRL